MQRLWKILVFIVLSIMFYLMFAMPWIGLVKTGEPGGGSAYKIIYNYSPIASFILAALAGALYSREKFINGIIIGTLIPSIWILGAIISMIYNKIVNLGPLLIVIVLIGASISSLIGASIRVGLSKLFMKNF